MELACVSTGLDTAYTLRVHMIRDCCSPNYCARPGPAAGALIDFITLSLCGFDSRTEQQNDWAEQVGIGEQQRDRWCWLFGGTFLHFMRGEN